MARTAFTCLTLLVVATAFAACGGGDDPLAGRCTIDESRFRELAATAGTAPRFTWCGAPATALAVRTVAAERDVWRVECTNTVFAPLCIVPGVVYGETPDSTRVTVPAAALQAGTPYRFCLSGVQDVRPPTQCLEFTP
ncbi:MAG: hypothetical protein H0V09_09795 [Gemmatimonadetes bacterium]|nr:hypothetical protein [Gemmatimonadota bacterium]